MPRVSDTDVVILAGGLGTRLQPRFTDLPKVLVPVNGRPFLAHLLDRLRAAGARRVLLALGHLAGSVESFLREKVRARPFGDLEISVNVELQPLGTGGALRLALPWIDSERVLVLNGDTYAPIDLDRLCALHVERGAEVSIALACPLDAAENRYGTVEIDADGRVMAFREKSGTGCAALVSAGVYVVERRTIESVEPDRPVSLERDVFPRLLGRIFAMDAACSFLDLGTPESYELAGEFLCEVAR